MRCYPCPFRAFAYHLLKCRTLSQHSLYSGFVLASLVVPCCIVAWLQMLLVDMYSVTTSVEKQWNHDD